MKCFILDKEQRTDQLSTEFLSMKKKKVCIIVIVPERTQNFELFDVRGQINI